MLDFRRLHAWEKSHALAVEVCEFAVTVPMRYVRLADQLMSASTSVPANLAEGSGRRTKPERAQFFGYASGSASETEARILIMRDLGLIEPARAEAWCARIQEIRRMIQGLLRN